MTKLLYKVITTLKRSKTQYGKGIGTYRLYTISKYIELKNIYNANRPP